jgi:hypothetical protein
LETCNVGAEFGYAAMHLAGNGCKRARSCAPSPPPVPMYLNRVDLRMHSMFAFSSLRGESSRNFLRVELILDNTM